MKGGQPISLSVRLSYLAIAHTMTPKYVPHVRTGLRISPLKAQSGNFTSDEAVHWHSHLSHKGRGGNELTVNLYAMFFRPAAVQAWR